MISNLVARSFIMKFKFDYLMGMLVTLLLLAPSSASACFYDFTPIAATCTGPTYLSFCSPIGGGPSVGCLLPGPYCDPTGNPDPCACFTGGTALISGFVSCPEGPAAPPPSDPGTPPVGGGSAPDSSDGGEQAGGPPPTCGKSGSYIRIESLSVSETIPLVGAPFSLVYSSERVVGRTAWYKTRIPLTSSSYTSDPTISSVSLNISVAGQSIPLTFPTPTASLNYDFTWDGKNGSGTPIAGTQAASITVNMNYTTANPYPHSVVHSVPLGAIYNEWIGLGGWDISIHHQYDSVRKILMLGTGGSYKVGFETLGGGNHRVLSEDGSEAYIFDSGWRHISTLTGLIGATKYTFAYTSGRLSTVTDAYSNVSTFGYSSGALVSITAPFGQVTGTTLDGNGYLATVTNPNSEVYTMTNYSGGLLHTFTKPGGAVSTMVYDGEGLLISDSSSAGSSMTLGYTVDPATNANVVTATTAEGRVDTHTMASSLSSYSRSDTNSSSLIGTYSVDFTTGIQSSSTNNSYTENRSYGDDARFGVLNRTLTSRNITQLGYLVKSSAYGQSVSLNSSDPFDINTLTTTATVDGDSTTTIFTGSTKTAVKSSALGHDVTTIYDAHEKVTSSQNASFTPVTFTYDSYGRLHVLAQGMARATTLDYNGTTGWLESVTNPLSQVTTFGYDSAGRVNSITLPDTRVIAYTYDSNGNLASITPPGKSAHVMTYNGFDLLGSYVGPTAKKFAETIGLEEPLENAAHGFRKAWRKLVRGTANIMASHAPEAAERLFNLTGPQTDYIYNDDRQLVEIDRPDSQVITMTYSSTTPLLESLTQPSGTNYFYTDGYGNITNTTSVDGVSRSNPVSGTLVSADTLDYGSSRNSGMSYGYNTNHQIDSDVLTTNSVTSGTTISYVYNSDKLLTGAGSETITRTASTGLPSQTAIGSNMKQFLTYSSSYGELSQLQAKYSTTVKYQEDLTRDDLGRVSARTEIYGGTTTNYGYTYDSAGRLTAMSVGGSPYSSYSYDTNSNRTSQTISGVTKTPTYDGQDRLSTFGTKTYSYNANGERTSVVDSGFSPSQTTNFSYDALGNLKSVTLPSSTVISYLLDATGRRVVRKSGSTVTARYVYDLSDRIVAVLASSGSITMRFIYGIKGNVPDYVLKGSTKYQIVSNHLGSPVQVINTGNGTISQEIKYDEWGNITSDSSAGFQVFGFAGGLYDTDTKLTHFGAREYDASTGRWLSKDPIRFDGGDTNLYGYVLSDPINSIDPEGTSIASVGLAACALLGAAQAITTGVESKLAFDLIAQIDSAIANAEKLKEKSEESSCASATRVNNNALDAIAKLRAQRASVLAAFANSNATTGTSAFAAFVCAGFAKGL